MIRNVDAWEANATCTFVKPFNRRTVQKQGPIPRPYLKDNLTRGHGAPRRQGALASRLYRTTAVERVKLGIGPNSLCRWCYYKGVLTLRQADAIGAPRCAAATLCCRHAAATFDNPFNYSALVVAALHASHYLNSP